MINQEIEQEPEEKQDKALEIIINVLGGAFVLFLLAALFFVIDMGFLKSKYYNKVMYPASCDYKVPEGYKIVYSADEKQYAVAVFNATYGVKYLYNGSDGIKPMYYDISPPCTFDDSCEAKGYLKAYMMKAFSTFK